MAAPLAARAPVRHHKGRVALLGDAAHAPLQSLAQGACMAIEDGFFLAETIAAAGDDFAAAFRRFETIRLTRTARVQLESRSMWTRFPYRDCRALGRGAFVRPASPEPINSAAK
jgi:salicylate hydroxylase